jgi:hypothetical protein
LNAQRRARINKLTKTISEIQAEFSAMAESEQEKFDGRSDAYLESDAADKAQDEIDALADAAESLNDAVSTLSDAFGGAKPMSPEDELDKLIASFSC